MNAIEFVKKFGIENIKIDSVWFDFGCSSYRAFEEIYGFRIAEDLKQIVEAFELVEKAGGLDKAKFKVRLNNAAMLETSKEFKQAIELVEKVNASD